MCEAEGRALNPPTLVLTNHCNLFVAGCQVSTQQKELRAFDLILVLIHKTFSKFAIFSSKGVLTDLFYPITCCYGRAVLASLTCLPLLTFLSVC